jgi:Protein of unknown function (DUF3604)
MFISSATRFRHPIIALLFVVGSSGSWPLQATESTASGHNLPRNMERNAYFGDLHVHTSLSLDAYIFGTAADPRNAYRFARGEEVELAGSIKHRLRVPLDFAAITDHAETFAEIRAATDPANPAYDSVYGNRIRANDVEAFIDSMTTTKIKEQFFGGDKAHEQKAATSVWQDIQDIADEFYEPGRFTTLKGWEYSWAKPSQMMLHRNVIFRGDYVTPEALGYFDLPYPENLWRYLDENCTGECAVLTIPHNPNWSWGFAFSMEKPDERGRYSVEELRLRAQLERLVEIQQVKGNSEAFIGLGATDEDADYEQVFTEIGELGETGKMAFGSTVRNGLKRGMELERLLGFNPFKLGIIASTDNHNGVAGDTQEDTYNGHEGVLENKAEQRRGGSHSMIAGGIRNNPGGLAGVWAEANAREHIWDALARRETWGTSGTRIKVRFFGGYHYTPKDATSLDWIRRGYAKGVPMGGDLGKAPTGKAPTFLIAAMMDPGAANLDRVQVIKGWVDQHGAMQEKVYEAVWSGERKPDATGKLPPVGSTVNLKTGQYTNAIGAPDLSGYWSDPDFDPANPAFYYLRVLEIPTPRYSTFDAISLGEDPEKSDVPATIQERAWTSPIWYTP